MSYLQVKNHALLNYTKMELYFTLLKVWAFCAWVPLPYDKFDRL